MAGILVFLPGYTGVDPKELVRRGLGSLLDPQMVTPIFTETHSGPDSGHGKLVTFDSPLLPPTPREADLSTQAWLEAPPDGELAKGRYWLGYVKDQKPSAGELQRATLHTGVDVLLADGNRWTVPIADYMPCRLTRNPNTGAQLRVPREEHRTFADWSNELYQLFLSDGFQAAVEKENRVEIPDGLAYAALALAKNYRVSADVIDLLELIGDYEAFEIARVATGMVLLEQALAQKKSTGGESQHPVSS